MNQLQSLPLEWRGPIKVGDDLSPADLETLSNSGVYVWDFANPPFSKSGLYIGKSVHLANRLSQHLVNTMSGQYTIWPHENPSYNNGEQHHEAIDARKSDNLGSLLRRYACDQQMERCLEHVRELRFYYASCDSDLIGEAEGLLVRAWCKLVTCNDEKFFRTQRTQDTRKPSGNIVLENTGAGPIPRYLQIAGKV